MVVGSFLGSGGPSEPIGYLKNARPDTRCFCFSQMFEDCAAVCCGILVSLLLVGSGVALCIVALATPLTAGILIAAGTVLLLVFLVCAIILYRDYRKAPTRAVVTREAAARETPVREETDREATDRRWQQILAEHVQGVEQEREQMRQQYGGDRQQRNVQE